MSQNQDRSEQMEHVNIRIPSAIRRAAQERAKAESTEFVEVKEAHIYRRAIEFFLQSTDSKTIQNCNAELSKPA